MPKDSKGHGSNAKAAAYAKRQAALSEQMIAAGTHERRPDGNGVVLKRSAATSPASSPLKGRGALSHAGEVGGYASPNRSNSERVQAAKEAANREASKRERSGSALSPARHAQLRDKVAGKVRSTTQNRKY